MEPTRQRRILSVSALTSRIKGLLEEQFTGLWVEGEISNFTAARSGHWYFTLKDAGAQLPSVMFKGQNRLIPPPKEGASVLMYGRLNVYEPRGNYQFIASSLQDRGAGLLMERFEALKRRLAEEGLFDPDKKRPLPFLPRRIALVTSPEGAAVRDMIRVILRRMPRADIVVAPTRVQGELAPAEIAMAIDRAGKLPGVDVLIVGRGGGSIEDLWAFNEEGVARTIRACPVPVVSAVGHEVDFTIADFVADVRAATPSVAGELVAPLTDELGERIEALAEDLARAMRARLKSERQDLRRLAATLKSPRAQLADKRLRLDDAAHRLMQAERRILVARNRRVQTLAEDLARLHPGRRFERSRARFFEQGGRLHALMRERLTQARTRMQTGMIRLDGLSPLNVLGRGYSLVMNADGRAVRRAQDVASGDELTIYPAKGRILARVTACEDLLEGQED